MIIVGIVLAILAAAIGTASKQLIAFAEHLKKPFLFNAGVAMNVFLGPLVEATAYAFAPQVIVAPFASIDVILNTLIAPYTLSWLNEHLTKAHIQGTALVATGAVLSAVFATHDNRIYTVHELEAQLFHRPTSLCYMFVELLAICMANVLRKFQLLSPAVRGISLGVVAGVMMGNVFFLKGLLGIIHTTARTGSFEAWFRPTPYFVFALAIGGAVCGHIFMRNGLCEYKGLFMVTIYEGARITAACLSGCVVMEEMEGSPTWRYLLYWLSVLTILGGMLVINLAAADAQIEGKFHIAQSFADVHPDEAQRSRPPAHQRPPKSHQRPRPPAKMIGRGAQDHDLEALAPQREDPEDAEDVGKDHQDAFEIGDDNFDDVFDDDLKDSPLKGRTDPDLGPTTSS